MAISSDVRYVNCLKGVAILGVIGLHLLSAIHYSYEPSNPWHFLTYALDQLFRLSVPLFVALSGYALTKRYAEGLNPLKFFTRRLSRLIPLFLLWSGVFIYVNQGIPHLSTLPQWLGLLKQIGLGHADYHLYFVPMIIQLYLLFPLLVPLMRRYGNLTLVALSLIQGFMLLYVSPLGLRFGVSPLSLIDQNHYGLSLLWIGYFGLGMWLAQRPKLELSIPVMRAAFGLMVGGFLLTLITAFTNIAAGRELIDSLRFTRLPVMVYGFGLTTFLLLWRRLQIPRLIEWMGKESYLIYLSHTLVIRIIFSLLYGTATLDNTLPLVVIGGVGYFIGLYL